MVIHVVSIFAIAAGYYSSRQVQFGPIDVVSEMSVAVQGEGHVLRRVLQPMKSTLEAAVNT